MITMTCLESRIQRDGGIYGRYEVASFKRGEGVTIATVLRRALLSELPGIAMTGVDIEGVKHEYCTMRGVHESVLDIICNLKEVVLAGRLVDSKPVMGHLHLKGPTTVRGGNIKLPHGLRCVNPEQYIATLTHDGTLTMDVMISAGKNYFLHTSARNKELAHLPSPAMTRAFGKRERHYLAIDATFMPIKRVNFLLRPDHSGTVLQEQLILEIWSNGSIDHLEAIRLAAKSVNRIFAPFEKAELRNNPIYIDLPLFEKRGMKKKPFFNVDFFPWDPFSHYINAGGLTDVANFEFSVKTNTFLQRNKIHSIKQLTSITSDLRRVVPRDISLEIEAHLYRLIDRAMRPGLGRVGPKKKKLNN